MTYSIEKEFIRDAFHSGMLDLGNIKTFERFCQIFAGELESIIAIQHARWLHDEDYEDDLARLVSIAKPTEEGILAYERWSNMAINGR